MSGQTKTNKPATAHKSGTEKAAFKSNFVFGKENYILMIAGLVVIIIGFMLMAGGESKDPAVFNPEIFSTRRIIIAPIVVLAGFVIEAIAIFRTPKD